MIKSSEKEDAIEGLREIEDIVLLSKDLKHSENYYLSDLYYFLGGKLKNFFLDSTNTTKGNDILRYRQGKWYVELIFDPYGIRIYCSGTRQGLNNQAPWSEDSYQDFGEGELQDLLFYLKEVKELQHNKKEG